jgi:hypothetical protein
MPDIGGATERYPWKGATLAEEVLRHDDRI